MKRFTPLLLCFAVSCTAGAPLYLIEQGLGQAGILWDRHPIDEVLEDPALPVEHREKLIFMREVRLFAKERLRLKDTESFQSYVRVPGEAVSYLVMAAPELELRSERWWFPLVGEVPYLGFFDPADADAFEQYLKKRGLDTHRGQAAAYSTLGWFSDPVFSSQLNYSKAYLAGLVIHEMVHSTVWVKGHPEFNEGLASFIEEKGRQQYFSEMEGEESPTVERLSLFREEEQRLNALLDETSAELKDLYQSSSPDSEKRIRKGQILAALKERLRRAQGFRLINTAKLADEEWNNARFAARSVYKADWPVFEREFDICKHDLPCFIEKYRTWAENPDENADRWSLY
jgi:predicted aminopeptidase